MLMRHIYTLCKLYNMDFLYENFVLPLIRNGWFNPYNTLVYGIGLIAGFFVVLKLLRRLRVRADHRLMAAIVPFIVFAGATRALRDYVFKGVLKNVSAYPGFLSDLGYNYSVVQEQAYEHIVSVVPFEPCARFWSYIVAWFPTPGSYLITFLIALAMLVVSVAWERKGGPLYWKTMGFVGIVFAVLSVLVLPVTFPVAIGLVVLFFVIWSGLFLLLRQFIHSETYLKWIRKGFREEVRRLFSWTNTGIVSAHILDASATFTALTFFSYAEQHVVPRAILPALGPVSMFILKIAVILPVLWLIDRYAEERDFRGLLKITILVLGLAPGIRGMLTLAAV